MTTRFTSVMVLIVEVKSAHVAHPLRTHSRAPSQPIRATAVPAFSSMGQGLIEAVPANTGSVRDDGAKGD